ncbi:SIMPL domain-containing protein [Streptomyces apocyni]|uniref:SIMPL domain-containing protein n=1 Tax=Streptomyces apocyni TaxID=2654677 RepID=UPI0012EA6671|nr:SIMPL domain-containing protein [Streptomyces apocyni]
MNHPESQPAPPVPHGTPDAPRVSVRGEAHLEVDPEIARITITITTRGTDRRTTLDDLTRRNTAALDLVKTYGEAIDKLETGSYSVTPELTKHGRGDRVRAYRGHVDIHAEISDFTALGELTTRIADLELTHVNGPRWALRPNSPAHREARRRAVQEAVQRAREYAEALGTHLDALIELADTGAENATPYGPYGPYGTEAMPAAGGGMRSVAYSPEEADAAAPLDLSPQRQTVYAQINARFTMAPPRL